MRGPKRILGLLAVGVVLASLLLGDVARAEPSDPRYFPETGFRIRNDQFWDFFQRRGGLRTFGYPVSRSFSFLSTEVQFFQRQTMQLRPDGQITTMNLLDEELMPYTEINGSVFPALDRAIADAAPAPGSADYGRRILEFVASHAPDKWKGLEVGFYRTFLSTVTYEEAYPYGGGDPGLMPGINLELWGVPTSQPSYDPNNHNFVYLRFQRGIMHYDAGTGLTQGLLLADYLKAIITGVGLPLDLEAQARRSRFYRQYNNAKPLGLNRPEALPGTDMLYAFEQEGPTLAPVTARVTATWVTVRSGPDPDSQSVTRLFKNTQVATLGKQRGADGAWWQEILLWNSVVSWIPADTVEFSPYPPPEPSSGGGGGGWKPPTPSGAHAPMPVSAQAMVVASTTWRKGPDAGAEALGILYKDTTVKVVAWATDETGHAWYQVQMGDAVGWGHGSAINFLAPDPSTRMVNGKPIYEPLRGKGMWFTYPLLERTPAHRIVQAAVNNGLTHLYVEVARSPEGFYGQEGLNELLPVAHAAGIKVIAWVYPYLKDIPHDVALTLEVARYRTPDGHVADGLTADIEQNMTPQDVKAYSELVRNGVGDDYLLIATTWPPESYYGPSYPWRIVARSWNVIVPMDYWHGRTSSRDTYEEAYGYVARSLALIREYTGNPYQPIEVLGQMYDALYPYETGPNSPSGDEVRGAMQAAKDGGAIGVSFFEWAHATAEEWYELGRFVW